MYKLIVKSEVRKVWKSLDAGDSRPVLKGFARRFRYENVGGDHALGGTFTTREAMAIHFHELFRLLPGLRFSVDEILVRGWPWNTSVVVNAGVSAQLPNGAPYENRIVQHLRLRWGKVTDVRALIDNVRAKAACEVLADAGMLSRTPVNA